MLFPLRYKLSTIAGRYQKSVLKNIEILLYVLLSLPTMNLNKLKDDLSSVLNNSNLKPNSYYKRLLQCVEFGSKSYLWLRNFTYLFQIRNKLYPTVFLATFGCFVVANRLCVAKTCIRNALQFDAFA